MAVGKENIRGQEAKGGEYWKGGCESRGWGGVRCRGRKRERLKAQAGNKSQAQGLDMGPEAQSRRDRQYSAIELMLIQSRIRQWSMCLEKEKSILPPNCNSNFQNSLEGTFPRVYKNQMTSSKKVWVFAVLEKRKLISAESKACTWKEGNFYHKEDVQKKNGKNLV